MKLDIALLLLVVPVELAAAGRIGATYAAEF